MKADNYSILLFKTNIHSETGQSLLGAFLSKISGIQRWTIDREDIDCVLRIVAVNLRPNEVIRDVNSLGFECAELE